MHIIFSHVSNWQLPLIRLFKYFKFKVFYLRIESESQLQSNKIATQLKEKNIIPLPLEFEKKISKTSYSLVAEDVNEVAYKKNLKMIPDQILKHYCPLFSVDKKDVKKLRLLIQDIVAFQQLAFSGRIGIWSNLYPSEKIIFLSFKFNSFFTSDTSKNIAKIIIPLDIFNYIIKILKNYFLSILKNKGNNDEKSKFLSNQNFEDFENKNVAFVVHKGLSYGALYQKSLYYSMDEKSSLNKHNILHLDYSNYLSPEKNIHWVCLKKIKISNVKIFLKFFLASIKTFYLIRGWSTFFVWMLCIQQYITFLKYCEVTKRFKKLKIAIIDYDHLCPKTLILAFQKNNIKTVATQDRFITAFYTSYFSVIVDTYYAASEYTADFIKSSKYVDVKNVIPMGQYRSDYIPLYKNKIIPNEISTAKNEGKKILIVLGNHSPNNWFESYTHPLVNWTAQINFLEDCIKLSQNLNNTYVVLRYKSLSWINNKFFKNILKKIDNYENIIISNNYEEFFYSYKLCANADLIIAKHTSIADECLSKEIPVLFYNYTHNMEKTVLNSPNYLPSELVCCNYKKLLAKSKSLLFNRASDLKDAISKLNKTIYYVREEGNVKNKIMSDCKRIILNG